MSAQADLDRRVPALLERARALLKLKGGPPDKLGHSELGVAARAVEALHAGLVGDRPLAQRGTYDDPAHLGAYLLWWWPQSYLKTRAALELAPLGLRRPRILDLGAGPAPAALAALDAFGGNALAVDASKLALHQARSLGVGQTQECDLALRAPELAGPFAQIELILAANFLLELPGAAVAHADFLERICARALAPGGVVVLIEPALRETGRALLLLRDQLLARNAFRALAPCFTQKPCPALVNSRDWCTAERLWQPPPYFSQLANATGLRADERLSYAPLVLARAAGAGAAGAGAAADWEIRPEIWRVVGVPPPEKGKRRLFLCNDSGRLPVALLDRDQRPTNLAFASLERGDRARLTRLDPKGDGLRVGKESEVEKK